MRLEKFQPEDWFMDDPLEVIGASYEGIMDLASRSVAFSLFDNEVLLACGGLAFWSEDEAEAWLQLSKKATTGNTLPLIRAIREGLTAIINTHDGEIFCWVDEERPLAQRFAGWFGFEKTETQKVLLGKHIRLWELSC